MKNFNKTKASKSDLRQVLSQVNWCMQACKLTSKISHTDGDGWQMREIICENAVKNWYAGSVLEKSLMI